MPTLSITQGWMKETWLLGKPIMWRFQTTNNNLTLYRWDLMSKVTKIWTTILITEVDPYLHSDSLNSLYKTLESMNYYNNLWSRRFRRETKTMPSKGLRTIFQISEASMSIRVASAMMLKRATRILVVRQDLLVADRLLLTTETIYRKSKVMATLLRDQLSSINWSKTSTTTPTLPPPIQTRWINQVRPTASTTTSMTKWEELIEWTKASNHRQCPIGRKWTHLTQRNIMMSITG